ncbi:MAG: uridine phosphorylase [Deltaproteobacteria bacterium]|nr:uridine phosphorylase [Deltaproteobacteria bacterium]NIS77131.1 uridine phosphorylase [Deltaproteobacteria bacterium]
MSSKGIEPPKNDAGRYYHIDCGPGDIHPYILTCGHPDRAVKIASFFDRVTVTRKNREFCTFTGYYREIPVTVMGTGIGPDNTAITVVEASQCVVPATFIRIGSCGSVQDDVAIGDLVITERALRDENTSHYYAPPTVEAVADREIVSALARAAASLNYPYHVGLTCTTSDFYAGQGWHVRGFSSTDPKKIERLRAAGVLNVEMEMSVYLTLAAISSWKLRSGGVTAVYDSITDRRFASKDVLAKAEMRCIQVGLRAVEIVYSMDREKGR